MFYTQFSPQVGSAEEHVVKVTGTSHDLQGLDQFTEHSVWLTAVNSNGGGDATPEVTARTFSDVPSKEPQNVSVEAASSRSLIICWEPPLAEHQNGIITSCKIHYKERGESGSSKTKATDGNRRLFALKKSTTYSIKRCQRKARPATPCSQPSLIPSCSFSSSKDYLPRGTTSWIFY
ncbi:netrin receptor DCC-like [Eriocheir sinensis]|uniref:netrin receptor DCC-like n=1 Tax=Eriocheir sinensis TaxID=95602 RepID=UPI0021C5B287|nr:netrin receptor DCC-like [Eriocheir sinensis]